MEEIKTSHFKTMEELLETLDMWEKDKDDDGYFSYCRFFDDECAYAMAHKIKILQEENQKLKNDNQVLKETLYGGNVSE